MRFANRIIISQVIVLNAREKDIYPCRKEVSSLKSLFIIKNKALSHDSALLLSAEAGKTSQYENTKPPQEC